jgi:toxin-antitoxin system PIN domain toxin
VIVVDVNILIAAFWQDNQNHAKALAWLEAELSRENAGVVVPDLVWVGFVRISTNPRVMSEPATVADAKCFVEHVSAAPGYLPVPGLTDGLDPFLELCHESESSGNLVPDAYIAAIARTFACPVATFDRDFRRFDGVETFAPA